jgi:hypothetical protein
MHHGRSLNIDRLIRDMLGYMHTQRGTILGSRNGEKEFERRGNENAYVRIRYPEDTASRLEESRQLWCLHCAPPQPDLRRNSAESTLHGSLQIRVILRPIRSLVGGWAWIPPVRLVSALILGTVGDDVAPVATPGD